MLADWTKPEQVSKKSARPENPATNDDVEKLTCALSGLQVQMAETCGLKSQISFRLHSCLCYHLEDLFLPQQAAFFSVEGSRFLGVALRFLGLGVWLDA